MLRVLSVAYPFAPVRPDTAGGAEQILLALDDTLVQRGDRSVVLAQEGSIVAGELVPGPRVSGALTDAKQSAIRSQWAVLLGAALSREAFDLVHMHGIDFHAYLPSPGIPVLVTLHLPLAWYPADALRPSRPKTFLHCVSRFQQSTACLAHLLAPIENGVAIPDGDAPAKSGHALMLTRICREKGVHLAIDAAKRADVPLIIAGEVFPYEDHERYFLEEVLPRLDETRRFIGPVGGEEKWRLLAGARCLCVASTIEETSSLVAREALAAGTPVVAFARGALLDTVDDGRTGFLVETVEEMAAAMLRAPSLDASLCRHVARERFSQDAMMTQYVAVYRSLLSRRDLSCGDAT